jgi:hypothetical protein
MVSRNRIALVIVALGVTVTVAASDAAVCRSTRYPGLALDERIMGAAEAFLDEVILVYRLALSSSFRTFDEQERLYRRWLDRGRDGNPVAKPGTSRHESGFAIDLHRLQELTFNQWNNVLNAGEKHGFEYILGDWEGRVKLDWPHFESDPRRFGLTLQEAIAGNRAPRGGIPGCR